MSLRYAQKPSKLVVLGTVSFYLVAALAMVMANKWVLNTTDVPIFYLWSQLVISVVLFLACNALGILKLDIYQLNPQLIRALSANVALSVTGLTFSNFTLKYVDASFYQVARGMVLPFTVVTSYYFLNSRPSSNILLACLAVTTGFFVGVFLDGTAISAIGVFFGVTSSVITALHSVMTKKSLNIIKGSALNLPLFSTLLSACVLAPVIVLAGETSAICSLFFDGASGVNGGMSPLNTFLWGTAITGVFGFLMSIATVISIKVTSPITHMVSSAVRGVAASFLGVWLFRDIITTGRAASIATILLGSVYYTWVKHVESQALHAQGTYNRAAMEDMEKGSANKSGKLVWTGSRSTRNLLSRN